MSATDRGLPLRVTWDVTEHVKDEIRVETHGGVVQAWVAVTAPAGVGEWILAVVADDDGTVAQVELHALRHEPWPPR